jgi:hypothetical protein
MAKHTTAFVIGTLLGGAVAAAFVIWNAPQSGERTRSQISEVVETIIFTMLGANQATEARVLKPDAPAPVFVVDADTPLVAEPA